MSVKSFLSVAALAAVTGLAVSTASATITIPTVPIGNVGNAADTRVAFDGTAGYGSVGYAYRMATTEVTNAQYAAFLNAVAATDPNGLFNPQQEPLVGIARSGSPGSYTYSTVAGRENHPVQFVSFWDSARFANWLHNGQPTGSQDATTTEDGAYTLLYEGTVQNTITRNAGALWALPSEDEWYKAAYHQPASQGGDADDYWLYPTSTNTLSPAQANIPEAFNNDTTAVGSYAANFYGLFDLAGNVSEWNEAIINGSLRSFRGGDFASFDGPNITPENRNAWDPWEEPFWAGFRVVQVPGPASAGLLAIAGLGMLRRRRAIGR